MRFLLKLFNLIRSWLKSSKSSESFNNDYRFSIVEDLPNVISNNEILVLDEGGFPELLAFKCPCGCDANIFLNLLTDTSPKWKYIIDNSKVSITPSIWKKDGCRSHFFIINSIVKWV